MSMNELRERLSVLNQEVRDMNDWLAATRQADHLPDKELDVIFATLRKEVQRRVDRDEDEIIRICETLKMMEEVMV